MPAVGEASAYQGDFSAGVIYLSLSLRSAQGDVPEISPVSPIGAQDRSSVRSPLCSPLKRQSSVQSGRLGSTKSLSAAVFAEKPPPVLSGGVQFSGEVSRSDENVLDSPRQRRSYGSFPFTPSADSNTFHQYRSADSSMSVADSEAYFSATEDFDPISSADEGPGTYPGRKKKRRQQMQQPQPPAYHMENYRSAPMVPVLVGSGARDIEDGWIKSKAGGRWSPDSSEMRQRSDE